MLTRAGGSLYTIKLKSACRKPDLSLSDLDPVPLSKIGTRLLASLGSKGKNRNSLACLRNAASHSAESYCACKYVRLIRTAYIRLIRIAIPLVRCVGGIRGILVSTGPPRDRGALDRHPMIGMPKRQSKVAPTSPSASTNLPKR